MLQTFSIFIAVLVILIIVHEFGHFIVAKFTKVKVEKFAIGFGKELIGRTFGETRYCVNLIPLGGYVKLYGENRYDKIDDKMRYRSFFDQSYWVRFSIIFAGPFFNLICSLMVLFCLYAFVGVYGPDKSATVNELINDSPAALAGLQVNDVIVEINGKNIADWEAMTAFIEANGPKPIVVTVSRNGKRISYNLAPQLLEQSVKDGDKPAYKIGIIKKVNAIFTPSHSYREALYQAGYTCFSMSKAIIVTISDLIMQKEKGVQDIGGPIAVAKATQVSYERGMSFLVYIFAMLGINLALINLIPIPMLDGGRLGGLFIEILRRGKPMPDNITHVGNVTGQIIIAVLLYIVVFNDIKNILTQ